MAGKVAVFVEVYRGVIYDIQAFDSSTKAIKAYQNRLKELEMSEEAVPKSEYDFAVETELLVQ